MVFARAIIKPTVANIHAPVVRNPAIFETRWPPLYKNKSFVKIFYLPKGSCHKVWLGWERGGQELEK